MVIFTVDCRTVSRWANGFRGIYVSIENDPRSGRPRISTDKRSVMLMADSLGKDRRAPCEEIPRATGEKPYQQNAQEPTSITLG